MDKPLRKKHVHFTKKEELHLANMILDGATYEEISEWHQSHYVKPI